MRVLMIGPGLSMISGISSLVQLLLPTLNEHVEMSYLVTVRQRPLKDSGKASLKNVALAISQYVRFLWSLLRFRPHIVHLHTSQGLAWLKDTFYILVCKITGCHIIIHIHAPDFGELYGNKPKLVQYYTRRIMGLADAVIAVSSKWKDQLASIIPSERISSFQNCIATDIGLPYVSRNSSDGPKALFLGSVGPRKGAFDLLEAMGQLQSTGSLLHLWLAGYEETEGDMVKAQTRLEELNLADRCELLGSVRGDRKLQLLGEADLFVLPSYNEGLPMAILEAMAAGLPIVATPVGGIPEVVRDGHNGFLVTPGDVTTLAEKLALLASDAHLREGMGQRSREIVEREFNADIYCERLIALYESLANIQGNI